MLLFWCHTLSEVAPIDHVYGTLGLVKASLTQEYSDISKLRVEIEGSGSYTFFAPSNDAWDLLEEVIPTKMQMIHIFFYWRTIMTLSTL